MSEHYKYLSRNFLQKMLLSYILLSCIVASNKEIANSNISSSTSAIFNSLESKAISEDIQMDAFRDKATISSINSSRESFMLSKVSSIEYLTYMNWSKFLPLVEFSYNNALSTTTSVHSSLIRNIIWISLFTLNAILLPSKPTTLL